MTSEIRQFVPKREIWFLVAVFVGSSLMSFQGQSNLGEAYFVGVTAMVRIGMHSIWKKD